LQTDLLGFLFDSKDEESMLLQNICNFYQTIIQLRRQYSSQSVPPDLIQQSTGSFTHFTSYKAAQYQYPLTYIILIHTNFKLMQFHVNLISLISK
jgi:hypothetical protein